jgi:hypothetical protein
MQEQLTKEQYGEAFKALGVANIYDAMIAVHKHLCGLRGAKWEELEWLDFVREEKEKGHAVIMGSGPFYTWVGELDKPAECLPVKVWELNRLLSLTGERLEQVESDGDCELYRRVPLGSDADD